MWPQVGLFGAFGGGLLSAFLLQDSKRFGIALFAENYMGLTWTACWWLINYSPFDVVYRVHGFLPVRMVSKVRPDSASLNPKPYPVCGQEAY